MKEKKIIAFDGDCNFCNKTANFILKKDKNEVFYFTSLNSKFIQEKTSLHPELKKHDSIFYLTNGKVYWYSDAVIKIGFELGGIYKLGAFILSLLPKSIRDSGYKTIAKHRKKIIKQDFCIIPTEKTKSRFLE